MTAHPDRHAYWVFPRPPGAHQVFRVVYIELTSPNTTDVYPHVLCSRLSAIFPLLLMPLDWYLWLRSLAMSLLRLRFGILLLSIYLWPCRTEAGSWLLPRTRSLGAVASTEALRSFCLIPLICSFPHPLLNFHLRPIRLPHLSNGLSDLATSWVPRLWRLSICSSFCIMNKWSFLHFLSSLHLFFRCASQNTFTGCIHRTILFGSTLFSCLLVGFLIPRDPTGVISRDEWLFRCYLMPCVMVIAELVVIVLAPPQDFWFFPTLPVTGGGIRKCYLYLTVYQ